MPRNVPFREEMQLQKLLFFFFYFIPEITSSKWQWESQEHEHGWTSSGSHLFPHAEEEAESHTDNFVHTYPDSRSPAKSGPWCNPDTVAHEGPGTEVCDPSSQSEAHPNDPFALYPTVGQPMSDVMMKDMLLSLCSSYKQICLRVSKKSSRGLGFGGQSRSLRGCQSYNNMVDAHAAHAKEIAWLKSKVANLEDHSR